VDFSILIEPTFLKAIIRLFHFIGLALGLGTATFLDLMLLRFMMWGDITHSQAQAFQFGTKVVTAGLLVLWITGLLFLIFYWAFDPGKLANPKIWAKLSVVGVLTGNAIYLHAVVLPIVERQISRALFVGTTMPERLMMVLGGTVSAVSWYVPVALGVIPQLNFSVSAQQIWLAYCGLVAVALIMGCGALAAIRHKLPPPATATRATRQSPAGQSISTSVRPSRLFSARCRSSQAR
jgi:hypothetical protein